jgi:16S rRNA (cytosine967-C5)-methyltransferase
LAARRLAADILDGVLRRHRPLDELLDGTAHPELGALEERDRALVRHLSATVLRRLGTLRRLIGTFVERGLPAAAPRVETALLIGAAQILWLEVPDHAAVDLAVRLAQADHRAQHFTGLVNAVLRRIAREGAQAVEQLDTLSLDTPEWLRARWNRAYGEATAVAIARSHAGEPALDLTVRSDPQDWATRLGGRVLPTGSVRALVHGPVTALPGYAEGAWWVQDAAAALPARLLGDIAGQRVADLCAAPGGKTAQLAAAGAEVVAVDRSAPRLARARGNLERLKLTAELIAADIADTELLAPASFEAVLLDAPCSSTGTIRRHPDIPWRKREADIAALAAVQGALLRRAADLTKPGGRLVYCVCSLEPEEGIDVVTEFLKNDHRFRRLPVDPTEVGGATELIASAGDLRTLPCHLADPDPRMAGLDGFYAARLQRLPAEP